MYLFWIIWSRTNIIYRISSFIIVWGSVIIIRHLVIYVNHISTTIMHGLNLIATDLIKKRILLFIKEDRRTYIFVVYIYLIWLLFCYYFISIRYPSISFYILNKIIICIILFYLIYPFNGLFWVLRRIIAKQKRWVNIRITKIFSIESHHYFILLVVEFRNQVIK